MNIINKIKKCIQDNKEILILLGIALLVWLVYFKINFVALMAPDAQYYASIARNLINGNGYHANLASPINFTYFGKDIFAPYVNPPLSPYLLAFLFKLGGVSDQVAAFGSGFFFIISIIPLYMLANLLFGRLAASVASIVYIFEPNMLYLSISGLTEPLFIFFLLMAFLYLARFLEKEKMSYIFWAGIFMGLGKLTRFNASVFIIMIALALFMCVKQNRWKAAALFLAGIICIHIPEFIRVLYVKTPAVSQGLINYAAADGTAQYPLTIIARLLNPPTSWEYILAYPKDFIYKYLENLFYYYGNLFTMANPFITSFFTISMAVICNNKVRYILLCILSFAIIAQVGLISYSVPIIRYFYIFIPFMIIFGVGFFLAKIYPDINSRFKKLFAVAMVFLFLLPTSNLYALILWDNGLLFRNYESKEMVMIARQKAVGDFIRRNTKNYDFIATDYISIAWHADRKALYLPISFDVLKTIDSKYKTVDAILLTSNSEIKDNDTLTGVAKQLIEWKKILKNPPEKLGGYILSKNGIIKGEKVVFYKRK